MNKMLHTFAVSVCLMLSRVAESRDNNDDGLWQVLDHTKESLAFNEPQFVSRSNNRIKQILRSGNAERFEKLIRDGYGYKLIGEYSTDPKIRSLLKSVPFYMARIDMVHEAVTKGHLRDVQVLTNISSPVYSVLKPKAENLVISKDSAGAGLLHKAVYYDHLDIVEWLIKNYPGTLHVRDKLGRIPLHYTCAASQPDRIWEALVAAGSEVQVEDNHGRNPMYYLTNSMEIQLPDRIRYDRFYDEEFTTKLSNIRIWIHEQDIDRLQQVIWAGQGEKLKSQTSNKPLMRKFLNGIPYIMAVIQEIHKAAIENDVDTLTKYCRKPVPEIILQSKDRNGATALHKACGLGHEDVIDFILDKYPAAVFASDNEGRTPAHYAAAFQQKQIYEKLLLVGANENIIEKNSRTAKTYKPQPGAIDKSVLLEIPAGPRGGIDNVYPSSFDWTVLNSRQSETPSPKQMTQSSFETCDDEQVDLSFDIIERDNVENDVMNYPLNPETQSSKPDFQITAEEEIEDQDYFSGTTIEYDLLADQESKDPNEQAQTNNSQQLVLNETTPNEYSLSKIDSHVELTPAPDEENGEGKETRSVSVSTTVSVDDLMKEKNLEEIGKFILEGYGQLLLGAKSEDEQIHEFLNHLPIYLKKIELIHYCCQVGNIEELQKYLDRRKFAVARESKSTLYLTPLHMAAAYNHKSIVRYLAGRFPETLKVVDRLGRTALHYTAIHTDGKYLYNMLLTLGADKTVLDENGFTAEYYYENPSKERYEQLMMSITPESGDSSRNRSQEDSVLATTECLNEFTKFGKSENDYIFAVLGDALKTGLSAMIHTRPLKPIKFLADYLYNYKEHPIATQSAETTDNRINENKTKENQNKSIENENKGNVEMPEKKPKELIISESASEAPIGTSDRNETSENEIKSPLQGPVIDYELTSTNQFQPLSRDKYGQTTLHYVAARTHSRNGLLQTLQDENGNLAYRDELYRTARDIATFAQLYENVQAIDEYVFYMAANGETDKIMQLIIDGYDHILEMECDEDLMDVVTKRGHMKMLTVLKTIPRFEELRDELHNTIRRGTKSQVIEVLRKCGKDAALLARCRNYTFRCSLHIAVLVEKKDIMKYLVKKFPETLHIGDNLNRTALHYVMALSAVEELSSLLIREGANRIVKDLKGRQPSYYFINKDEILHMREEELS